MEHKQVPLKGGEGRIGADGSVTVWKLEPGVANAER
jgi:hypothetical protein